MAALSPSPILKFFAADGITPLANGKIYTYSAGSLTPQSAYTNAAGTPATNPIILDATGEATIYLATSLVYRFIVKTSADVTLDDVDDIKATPTTFGTSDIDNLAITTAKINANAVTYAKMVDMTGAGFVGKSTSGSGDPEECTFSSDFSFTGTAIKTTTTERVSSITITAGAITLDLSADNYRTLSLTSNITAITFSNVPAAGRAITLCIRVAQDATGGRTIAGWPASVKWSGGAYTPSSAANAIDMISLTTHDQGTSYLGTYLKAFA